MPMWPSSIVSAMVQAPMRKWLMLADLPAAPWFRRVILASVIVGILLLTYMVLQPFLVPSIWAAILAFVTWPLHIRVCRLIRRRKTLAALVTTLLVSLVIVSPIVWLVVTLQTGW